MKQDLVPLMGNREEGTVYIPPERDRPRERREKKQGEPQIVLSMTPLPADRIPVPRPYQSE